MHSTRCRALSTLPNSSTHIVKHQIASPPPPSVHGDHLVFVKKPLCATNGKCISAAERNAKVSSGKRIGVVMNFRPVNAFLKAFESAGTSPRASNRVGTWCNFPVVFNARKKCGSGMNWPHFPLSVSDINAHGRPSPPEQRQQCVPRRHRTPMNKVQLWMWSTCRYYLFYCAFCTILLTCTVGPFHGNIRTVLPFWRKPQWLFLSLFSHLCTQWNKTIWRCTPRAKCINWKNNVNLKFMKCTNVKIGAEIIANNNIGCDEERLLHRGGVCVCALWAVYLRRTSIVDSFSSSVRAHYMFVFL